MKNTKTIKNHPKTKVMPTFDEITTTERGAIWFDKLLKPKFLKNEEQIKARLFRALEKGIKGNRLVIPLVTGKNLVFEKRLMVEAIFKNVKHYEKENKKISK
jgi:hypothetical protein